MKKNRSPLVLVMLYFVTASLLLASCGGGVPVTPSETSEVTPLPTQPPPSKLDADAIGFNCDSITSFDSETSTNGIYIDNQILLQGPGKELQGVATANGLTQIRLCNLTYISSDLVMALYNTAGQDPQTLSDAINNDPKSKEFRIIADPNYLIGPKATNVGACADPYSIGGSPNGDPYRSVPGDKMLKQWAFQKIRHTYTRPTGWSGVHVAVFDTVPLDIFRTVPPTPGASGIEYEKSLTLPWPNEQNNDSKFYLEASDELGPLPITVHQPNSTEHDPTDFSDHGLFVAGLIRAISPASNIHLIRVLNDNGCGDLRVVSEAIHKFMAIMQKNKITKSVLNLSLGAMQAPQMRSLEFAIANANKLGAVIVAAAGNDSSRLRTAEMQSPANYGSRGFDKFVIGVAATNIDGKRSCYSNKGDVSAPGGDGGQNAAGTSNCVPRANSWNGSPAPSCTAIEQCGYGVISLVYLGGRYGFGLWSGTSFATPLVSGLAALAYEKSLTPKQVNCLIQKGSTPSRDPDLGWGIIDVPNTLAVKNC